MKLIVGLGNPGKKYDKTRHNVGFMIVEELHKQLLSFGINDWELSKKFNAYISGCSINGEKIILAKPTTYMNRSGEAVQNIGHYYKMHQKDIVVVHDDKDIMLGEIKIQENRGPAGHNGIKSIIEYIGTQDFLRVRVGIASENKKKMSDIPKFVLDKFGILEKKKLHASISEAIEKIMGIIS
ncbi:MAG: aminoacyl-tRNA hydrolase [Candidatus Magasanikbacteria bacterium RIFOXYC12_FULL_33_11]|uniref:Peptidyl-tRNA hydrolase n=1 Tax=Candidatus Magasanikbacteria bacterium RIFOXYC12_FULL_33_11 TaxID=1798701 RepID=A0A1F6NM69_9BACT|nr:MAG: aminoacyl-tRNA hydrolase [Candidatus Magasanikbacteria bacterium RIFOXYC12_FULL_33_11]